MDDHIRVTNNPVEMAVASGSHAPTGSAITVLPPHRRVVAYDTLNVAAHRQLAQFNTDAAWRATRTPQQVSGIIRNAAGYLVGAPRSTATSAVVKDLSTLKTTVAGTGLSANVKYTLQKEATRAVWRNMPVGRTGLPGVRQFVMQRVGNQAPPPAFPPADLRDIQVLELNGLPDWHVRTGTEGAEEVGATNARKHKIVGRVIESLAGLGPKQQAEAVATMVAVSASERHALGHASTWLRDNPMNAHRAIVFDEAVTLCKDRGMHKQALKFLETHVVNLGQLPADVHTALKARLQDEVYPAVRQASWAERGFPEKMTKLIALL